MFNVQEKLSEMAVAKRELAAQREVARIMGACKGDLAKREKAFGAWDGNGNMPVGIPSRYQLNLIKGELTAQLFRFSETILKLTEGVPLVEFEKELTKAGWEPFVNSEGQTCYFVV